PTQLLLPVAALQVALQGLPEDLQGLATLEHLNGILTIAAVTWLSTAAIRGVANGVILLHPSEVVDNLAARRVQTQTRVLSRIASGTVLVAALSFALMTFPRALQIGPSL